MSIVVGIISNQLSSNKPSTRKERSKVINYTHQFVHPRKQQLLSMGVAACVVTQNAHASESWGGVQHITMECWSANAASIVAYCHIDAVDPTLGEVLDPDRNAYNRFDNRAVQGKNKWGEQDAISV